MKNLATFLITFLSFISFGQTPSKQQIALLNELNNKFNYIKDDFFPENNRYEPNGIKWYGYDKTSFYPVIKKNGDIYFKATYSSNGWLFIDKIYIKINDEVEELPLAGDCKRETVGTASILESCLINHITPHTLFEKLAKAPKVVVRYSGKSIYHQFDLDTEMWKDAFLFYQLMEKSGKFHKE